MVESNPVKLATSHRYSDTSLYKESKCSLVTAYWTMNDNYCYLAIGSLCRLNVADSRMGLDVMVIPVLLGHLPADDAKAQAGEEHQDADRQKTWTNNFSLPTPVLGKMTQSL